MNVQVAGLTRQYVTDDAPAKEGGEDPCLPCRPPA